MKNKIFFPALFCLLNAMNNAQAFTLNVVDDKGVVASQEMSEEDLLNDEQAFHRLMITLLNLRKVESLKVIYPIYQQLEHKDTVIILWAEGLLVSQQDPYQAIEKYETLLKKQPKLYPAQIQLALLYLQTRQHHNAKPLFYEVSKNGNKGYQNIAKHYLQFLKPIEKWDYDFSFSYIKDNNINNVAPKGTQYEFFTSLAEPKKAEGVDYRFNINRAFHFYPYFLGINLDASGKYFNLHQYDELDVYLRSSMGYEKGNILVGISPFYHHSWYAGGGDESASLKGYYRGAGANLFGHYYLLPSLKVSPSFGYESRIYIDDSNLNSQLFSYGLNFSYLKSSYRFDLGGNFKQNKTDLHYNIYNQWQFHLGALKIFDNGLGVELDLYLTKRHYKNAVYTHSLVGFLNQPRRDKEYQGDLTFWHNQLQYKGIMPKLTFEYKCFKSTDVFKNHTKKQLLLNFTKAF